MSLTKKQKFELFKKFSNKKVETDTGSSESQIVLFTHRIKYLNEHLKLNKKDNSSRLRLLKLVSKQKKLLLYLKKNNTERYKRILLNLNLRK
jgi:small subunit ribosomal protein S15